MRLSADVLAADQLVRNRTASRIHAQLRFVTPACRSCLARDLRVVGGVSPCEAARSRGWSLERHGETMKKLIVAAAVAAVASMGAVSRVNAQAFYPGPTGAPAAGGTYGTYGSYPGRYGTYPSYPQESASHRDRDHDRHVRNDRRDDDRRDRERGAYDRQARSVYGTTTASTTTPSRISAHESNVDRRRQSRVDPRDGHSVGDGRSRR